MQACTHIHFPVRFTIVFSVQMRMTRRQLVHMLFSVSLCDGYEERQFRERGSSQHKGNLSVHARTHEHAHAHTALENFR